MLSRRKRPPTRSSQQKLDDDVGLGHEGCRLRERGGLLLACVHGPVRLPVGHARQCTTHDAAQRCPPERKMQVRHEANLPGPSAA